MTERFLRGLSAFLVIFVLTFSPLVPPIDIAVAEEETTPTEETTPAVETETETAPETPDTSDQGTTTETETGDNGESGDNGTPEEQQQTTQSDGDPAVVDTGNAESDTTVVNQGNVSETDVDTNQPASPQEGGSTTTETASTTVAIDNDSSTTTTETTENSSDSTGAATSTSATTTTTDTPESSTTSSTSTATTTTPAVAGGGNVNIDTGNEYNATSTATSTSTTGDNYAEDPDGAYVFTGQSKAFGTLISLFNIAVTNSSGSILFLQNPLGSALDLTEQIYGVFSNDGKGGEEGDCSFLGCSRTHTNAVFNMMTENVARITNTLIVRSGTGDNAAKSSDGLALVDTGDASAVGRVINFGNLNIVESRYLVILMENIGDLTGDIVLPTPDFFATLSSTASVDKGSSFVTDNTADIENNATSTAGTGDNLAKGEELSAILTGNADADSQVLNFANQNALGGRPICFIVSVGGTWNGDVVGLPDGFSRERTDFGDIICGAGGSKKTSLPGNFNATTTNYAKILNNVLVEATTGGNTAEGDAAIIKTGDADAFLQILNVVNQNIIGQDWIFALFTITGDWNGDLMFGNQAFWDQINQRLNTQGGAHVKLTPDSELVITKEASVPNVEAPGSVDYTITVTNEGEGPAYHAQLFDTLYTEDGEEVYARDWWLNEIPAGEEIVVTYTMEFGKDMPSGTYVNEAQVKAITRHPSISPFYGVLAHTDIVQASIEVVSPTPAPAPKKIAEPAPTCDPYLTSYLGYRRNNKSEEVEKLQVFLKEHEGHTIEVTGVFDEATFDAVKLFQEKNADSILLPWGIEAATGYVYYTTQKTINDIACAALGTDTTFPLNEEQQKEISTFRERVERSQRYNEPLPETNTVGSVSPAPLAAAVEDILNQENTIEIPVNVFTAELDADSMPAAAANAQVPDADEITKPVRSIMDGLFNGLQRMISFPLIFNFGEPIARR